MQEKEELAGGRKGKIHKIEGRVIRPANSWTKHVHGFLKFIRSQGETFVPEPLSLNDSEEEVSFMAGEVHNYPLPKFFLTDEMLISASNLLKKLHQYGEAYLSKLNGNETWMLRGQEPKEVMCHGDYAPYNVSIENNEAVGIIDFDTLHPGPRMWDIAYGIYRWVPFKNPNNPDSYADLNSQISRAKVFLNNYGVTKKDKISLPDFMILRLEGLVNYMKNEAEKGNYAFQANIDDGHMKLYIDDIEYFKENKEAIINGIQ